MERMAWSNERLDDLVRHMDAGFERVDANFERVDGELRELRAALAVQGTELRGEIGELRSTLIRVGGGIMAGLVGVIAAVLLGS
jgi:hypothetical protein